MSVIGRIASVSSYMLVINENDVEKTFELLQNESLDLIASRIC